MHGFLGYYGDIGACFHLLEQMREIAADFGANPRLGHNPFGYRGIASAWSEESDTFHVL
ncbi:MAG TPA: hypothetical protein VKW08_27210 [Xanthobacteraceae bacterium]|nr:hypothetical protein [Xanthobacteraceae bacterium]